MERRDRSLNVVRLGRCCSRYGVSSYDIAFITKDFVRSYVRRAQSLDVILTMRCLLELLYVRHGYSSLGLFTRDELLYATCHLSTSQMHALFFVVFIVSFLRVQ